MRLLLAKIYIPNGQYAKALEAADECIRNEDELKYNAKDRMPPYFDQWHTEIERMSAPAHVIKAKAERSMGKLNAAKSDAELAAKQFFQIARVECRDKLTQWSKDISTDKTRVGIDKLRKTLCCPQR